MDSFDVNVIGAGPAGENVAGRCADGGLSVGLAERELVSGECAYWACIPSKTLIRPGDAIAAARRVPGATQAVSGRLAAAAALARRHYTTSSWKNDGHLPWLEEKGITLLRGVGRLIGERSMTVQAHDGTDLHASARRDLHRTADARAAAIGDSGHRRSSAATAAMARAIIPHCQ